MSITKADLLDFLKTRHSPVKKKMIADALGVRGDSRVELKRLLKYLEGEGLIVRHAGNKYAIANSLPNVLTVEISHTDQDGNNVAIIPDWDESEFGQMPSIFVIPDRKKSKSLNVKDRVLVRLKKITSMEYDGTVLRHLGAPQSRIMGIIKKAKIGFTLKPISKKSKFDFDVSSGDLNDADHGDVVIAEIQPQQSRARGHQRGGRIRKKARVVEIVGSHDDPKAISRISLHEEGLRERFLDDVLDETKDICVPSLKGREDYTHIPLVTIDGEDAKDFDDAVFAQKADNDLYHIIVAIADVAHYVRSGSKLDQEAWTRGNSTYFPDRVVPMLPEALSNDVCSLRPNEDRAVLAANLWIDDQGRLVKYTFKRALIRSKARLTYNQVQKAYDGQPDKQIQHLMDDVIAPLYKAFDILKAAREKRGALEIDLPERQILIDQKGYMTGVQKRDRLDAHMLIEELMILANIAAASALEEKQAPCVYRVHDQPDGDKLAQASMFLQTFNLNMKQGQIKKPEQLNKLLSHVQDHPCKDLVHEVILRAQSSAVYSTENIGHFGLDLKKYAHFTSPIRRYADLIVHRSLIKAYGLGPEGLSDEELPRLEETCAHISSTERSSMIAERNAVDRFAAHYLAQQDHDQIFKGRIRSVTNFGFFVSLDDTGVDGLVPVRRLGGDYFVYYENLQALIGEKTGLLFRLGSDIMVKIIETDPITGSTTFEPAYPEKGADIEGYELDLKTLKRPRRRFKSSDERSHKSSVSQKKSHQKGRPSKRRKKPGQTQKRRS